MREKKRVYVFDVFDVFAYLRFSLNKDFMFNVSLKKNIRTVFDVFSVFRISPQKIVTVFGVFEIFSLKNIKAMCLTCSVCLEFFQEK